MSECVKNIDGRCILNCLTVILRLKLVKARLHIANFSSILTISMSQRTLTLATFFVAAFFTAFLGAVFFGAGAILIL